MKRCGACGAFFEGVECPTDHSTIPLWHPPGLPPARLCAVCGHYFLDEECPNDHTGIIVADRAITVGSPVTCDVSELWNGVESLPGIIVSKNQDDSYRILVALPGDQGSVSAVTLPAEKVSW